jgi:hypothetical protein
MNQSKREASRSLPSGADVCELRVYTHALLHGGIPEVQTTLLLSCNFHIS